MESSRQSDISQISGKAGINRLQTVKKTIVNICDCFLNTRKMGKIKAAKLLNVEIKTASRLFFDTFRQNLYVKMNITYG